ncbi:MAG: nitroreductase [Ruminococcaceae bacterium]|nr:nitroreductase [Oscillospiraceae bacterium]
MNEIIKSLWERKSIRAFEEKKIPSEAREIILSAALQAPSAGNMTLYTIIDVQSQKLKDTLAVTCDNQPFIAKAPLVLVFCADFHRWYNLFTSYCEDVRKPSLGDLQLASVDAVIAAHNCVVAAESLGIGSCYIGDITENFEKHKELFNLPQHVVPVCMLVLGYPTQQQKERIKPNRFKVEDIVYKDTYDIEKANCLDRMLKERENKSDEEFKDWVVKFLNRKHNSEFSIEMSRSCEEMVKEFTK